MIFTECLHVLEAARCESGFDHLCPNFLAINFLSNFLPLDDPCTVYFAPRLTSLHTSEAIEVKPSLEFLELCLVDFCSVFLYFLLRKIVALAIDDCREGYVIWIVCALLEDEDEILIVFYAGACWQVRTQSGKIAREIKFYCAIVSGVM